MQKSGPYEQTVVSRSLWAFMNSPFCSCDDVYNISYFHKYFEGYVRLVDGLSICVEVTITQLIVVIWQPKWEDEEYFEMFLVCHHICI